jgi:hypothetical protein
VVQNLINLNVGMKSFFRGCLFNTRTGIRRPTSNWIPNSMLLSGMNQMADFSSWAGPGSKCQVGTVSVPAPSTNDTQLLGYIDGTSITVENTTGAQPSEPFFAYDRTTYQFPVGPIGEEDLQEAGVGWSTAHSPAALISRALFTDGLGGNPTFTPLADEIMQVQVETRYYPPLEDVLGTVVLNGITYNTISRASLVTNALNIGKIMGIHTGPAAPTWKAYTGTLGTIEQAPNGTPEEASSGWANQAYSNNTFRIDMQFNIVPGIFNDVAGIRSIWIATNAGFFQTQFNADGSGGSQVDDPIFKTDQYTISLMWRLAWAEKVL